MTSRNASRRAPASQPPPRRIPVVWAALGALVVVALVGVVIALAGDADDDDDAATGASDALVYGEVTVDGAPLPVYDRSAEDPGVGVQAPVLAGQALDGSAVRVGEPGEPTLVTFLAHWCPHCRAELPVLVDLADDGAFDGVRTVAVLTGTNAQAPNFPPADWLADEGWTGDVLVDDEASTAALAYGLDGYPLLVVLDADGQVVARRSGEVPAADVRAMVEGLGA